MSNIGDYRKIPLTRMALTTGDNFEEVRDFVRDTAFRVVPVEPADPGNRRTRRVPVPWGFADATRFDCVADDYRSDGVPVCPPYAGYEGSGGYREGEPDYAVFDYLHGRWIPLWVGDFVATGPQGEHYPVEATVHAETYEKVV